MNGQNLYNFLTSMMNRTAIEVIDRNGKSHYGVVNQIQAEDGSGKNFNIVLDNGTSIFFRIA